MTADERDARLAAIRQRWGRLLGREWYVDPKDRDTDRGPRILERNGWTVGAIVSPADAKAIAHAPVDVAWLLAELERITAELRHCRVEHEELAEDLGLPEDDRDPPLGG